MGPYQTPPLEQLIRLGLASHLIAYDAMDGFDNYITNIIQYIINYATPDNS